MRGSLTALKGSTAAALVVGVALAYWRPQWPLLSYWLLCSIALGVAISFAPALAGLSRRAAWLMTTNACLVAVALGTTQCAARRVISPTHLTYRGVHVVGVDSFTVGTGESDVDVRLQSMPTTSPWSVRVARHDSGWSIEPLGGVEQLRLSRGRSATFGDAFDVAESAVLTSPSDWAVVVSPSGVVVDTIRLVDGQLRTAAQNVFLLDPIDPAIATRYRRVVRGGGPLSALDGQRRSPSFYERFVRVQELSGRDIVNRPVPPFTRRVAGALHLVPRERSVLLSASPPYSLRSAAGATPLLDFKDSALVEVRSGGIGWQFRLARWRREPSADVGLALFFVKNPRPLDTPLPTGVSCRPDVACGAISLRRLPSPVAQVTLDFAGFDPSKFGMLGRVEATERGYSVILPRQVYAVDRSNARPIAIPVAALPGSASRSRAGVNPFWILLSASSTFGDDSWRLALIALGLAFLLAGVYTGVASSVTRTASFERIDERSLTLGIVALLALLLSRIVVGARVAFFAPFLERSIQTAVGMWVAIAVVTVGLLAWPAWLPQLLAGARNALSGQVSARRVATGFGHSLRRLAQAGGSPRFVRPALTTCAALVCLGIATPAAVIYGIGAGTVVLLAWVCLAWVAAFSGRYFETFDRGAWSVVEQLAPNNRLAASTDAVRKAGTWSERIPELPIIVACLVVELSLVPALPSAAVMLAAVIVLAASVLVALRRRRALSVESLPDWWGTAAGIALFTLAIAVFRSKSENGSMATFVLIIFVALASVRIGRSLGARMDADVATAQTRSGWSGVLVSSMLLVAPLALLAPLMIIDMGLFLVVVIPVGFATLLATGWRPAGWRLVAPAVAFTLLFGVLAPRVLFPSVKAIRDADSHAGKAAAFESMTRVAGARLPLVSTSLDRVAARSVATVDRHLAEELLVSARPGQARDLLIPSVEQIWGGKTYASAGFWGAGLGQAVVGGRGIAEAVSYAENTFAVFILAEHGALGGLLVLALYLLLTGSVGAMALSDEAETTASYRASRALLLVATLLVVIPAVYVALSNLGTVPITGQNMPFLGLNAWSDVALCAGVVGILITGAIRRMQEAPR